MEFPFPTTPQEAGPGKLISYISLQPGSGATTLACMHASVLPGEVALIDFSPTSKVRTYTGLTDDISAANILNIKNINEPKEIYLAGEKQNNVFVFPGIPQLLNYNQVDARLHFKAIVNLKKAFKNTVAVLGELAGPSWISAMLSDTVCVIVGPHRSDMDVFRKNLEFLNRLGCGARIKIILNQAGHPSGIKTDDCKQYYRPDFIIPYDMSLIKSGNTRKLVPKAAHIKIYNSLLDKEEDICEDEESQDRYLIGSLAARDGLVSESIVNENKDADKKEELLPNETYKQLRSRIQQIVREQFSMIELDPVQARNAVTRAKFNEIVAGNLDFNFKEADIPHLADKLFDDILGYGPLEKYFMDPEVTEIKVNNTQIKVEKKGVEIDVEQHFDNQEQAVDLVRRMITHTGRRIDSAEPEVNARLHDGSRLIAQIAPVAVDGILITIRRFRQDIDANKLIINGAASKEVMDFMQIAVETRCNVIIAGGTSSGKTTWLNVLASFIPTDQSIITIEDPAELQLLHPDVRRLEARPANIEGKGIVTQADLVKSSLRMAPDRIIVGEIRGKEAFDMLQAMNTGHDGSMGTAHAKSGRHCIARITNMVEQAGMAMPHDAILDQIADVVDFILFVQQDRKTGTRRLDHIIEINGVEKAEDGRTISIITNLLWQYDQEGQKWLWHGDKNGFMREEQFRMGGWKW